MKNFRHFYLFILLWLMTQLVVSAQSPVINLPFNGNAKEELSGLDARVNGISLVQDRFGFAARAAAFDGTQSELSIPAESDFNTDHVSVSLWVKVNSIPVQGEAYLFSYGGWQQRFKVSLPNHGKMVWTTNSDNGITDIDAGDGHEAVVGTWQHWVFVQDGTNDLIYLNGVLVNSKPAPGKLNASTAPFGLGYNPVDGGNYFNGVIDEVKVFDGALDATQVEHLYQLENTNPTTGETIVASYKLDGNAKDYSTFGNNGSTQEVTNETDRFGFGGSALGFNGVSSAVTAPNSSALNSPNTSISFWVKPNSLPVSGEAFIISNGGWQERLKISVPGHGKIVFTTNASSGISDMDAGDGHTLVPGIWTHVVAVHDGTNDKIYINGSLANTKAVSGSLNATGKPFGIGYDAIDNTNFFDGVIDQVEVYNYGMTDAQVADLYAEQNTFPGTASDIAANYSMNGNGADDSQYGNTAEGDASATTNRFGWANNAIHFDGAQSYTAPNSVALNSDYATYSFWVKMDELPVSGEYFLLSNGGWQQRVKISVPGHGKVVFTTNSTSGISDMDAGDGHALVPGEWSHVVAVHDGAEDIIYINGEKANSKAVSGTLKAASAPFGLGWNPIDNGNNMVGSLDDVIVFNRALSATEVTDLYNAQKNAPSSSDPLIANYTFTNNADDVTAYKNNASSNDAQLAKDRFKKANRAYSFDGTASSMIAANSAQQNSDYTTIAFWINVKNLPVNGEAFILSNGGWQERWKISLPSHGKPVFTTNGTGGISDMDSGNSALTPGTWTHVAMTHDGAKDKIYINGQPVASKDVTGTLHSTTQPLGFGWNPIDGGNFLDGSLDEVRIYNRALTDQEVADLFASQSTETPEADTEAPSTPLNLVAAVDHTNIGLSWSPSTDNVGVTAYNVYQDGAIIATTSDVTHRLTGLTPQTKYILGVSAVDAAGNESGISTLEVTSGEDETPDTTPPTVPGNLSGVTGAHSVLLSWDPSVDDRGVKGYVVSVDGTVFDTLSGNITSVLVDGLDAETPYSFEVYSFDKAGNNSDVAELTLTTTKEVDTGEPGLVAYYPFEGNANDATPYANHGTIGGNATFEATSHPNGGGQNIKFDGDRDSVLVSNAVQLISDFATIAFWIRVDEVNPNDAEAYVLDFGHWDQRWKISLPKHTRIVFTTNSKTTQFPSLISDMDSKDGNEMVPGFWWHVIMTHDGTNNRIYVNGEMVNEVSAPGTLNATNRPFCMGSNPIEGGQYFHGALDEVKLYNKALTGEEAVKLYTSGTTGTKDLDRVAKAKVESVFPNPTTDRIWVRHQFDESKPLMIRIMDVQGRQVDCIRFGAGKLPHNVFSIGTSHLSAGSYYLNFVSEEHSLGSVKFQVN